MGHYSQRRICIPHVRLHRQKYTSFLENILGARLGNNRPFPVSQCPVGVSLHFPFLQGHLVGSTSWCNEITIERVVTLAADEHCPTDGHARNNELLTAAA